MNDKILKRTKSRKIGGVANGIAVYLNIDPVIVRALFLFSICFGGVGIILYIILLFVMPEEDQDKNQTAGATTETVDATATADSVMPNEDKKETKELTCISNIISSILGLCLIFTGAFFLIRSLIPHIWHQFYFPSVLIFLGILCLIIPVFTRKKK